ncbi:MAG: hypothetical protein IJ242_02940 [Clostridia bacterium]|nr:hypothetical protein [Clostridia bacterium]
MLAYQEQYIRNTREIADLYHAYSRQYLSFDDFLSGRLYARTRIAALKSENTELLETHLFPALDDLFQATPEAIASLTEFAGCLMDWKVNLDIGVYVKIHDALLSLCRIRRDRNGTIRELYLLGMGLYYLQRIVEGTDEKYAGSFHFQNEMLFTEAGSYIRYYDEIDDETTRGYIIRALANVALTTKNHKRKISASAHALRIIRDAHYRQLAPSLPWDAFLRKTHQQMCANRAELSQGDLTTDELAAVLDSCYEVFRPEAKNSDPSVRWLWPYYEMEYNCGMVSLQLTLERLQLLINRTPVDSYDMSGLYGNVQLPIYYGHLMRANPRLQSEIKHLRFLDHAYRKMQEVLTTCPPDHFDDYFFFNISMVISEFFELPGLLSYREITTRLMQRIAGEQYVRFRKTGQLIACICEAIVDREPAFFDDIPFLAVLSDPAVKRQTLLTYAEDCGLYFDFGYIKMNIGRMMQTRNLFEEESRMLQLHTVSGHDDLLARESTQHFADIALGHHRAYNGTCGFPETYVRTNSPYRQMTETVTVAAAFETSRLPSARETLDVILKGEGRQYSPLVTMYLENDALLERIQSILDSDGAAFYREIYDSLNFESRT